MPKKKSAPITTTALCNLTERSPFIIMRVRELVLLHSHSLEAAQAQIVALLAQVDELRGELKSLKEQPYSCQL